MLQCLRKVMVTAFMDDMAGRARIALIVNTDTRFGPLLYYCSHLEGK